MPRRPRVFVAGAWYHVYCRVARGEQTFAEPREAAALVDVIRGVKREHGFGVAAWCVMATHYHVVVRAGRVPLWRSMRLIQGRFARRHNRRHRLLGPFWQSRYQAIVVEDERYLQQVVIYVHLNPVVAKLANDPSRYRWSGHREILGRVGEPLADVDETLALFGSGRASARRAYVRVMRGARKAEWIGEGVGRLPWWGGGEDDVPVAPAEGVPRVDALGASSAAAPPRWKVGEYVSACCRVWGLETGELGGRCKDAGVTRMREQLVVIGVEVYGLRVKDLAEALGMNPGSASRVLGRAVQRERKDGEWQRDRLALEAALAENRPDSAGSIKVRK